MAMIEWDRNWMYVRPQSGYEKRVCTEYLNAATNKKGFRIPKNVWSMRDLCKVFHDLKTDANFIKEGKRLKDEMDTLLHLRKTMTFFDHDNKLRPYQCQDIAYLLQLQAAGVFNEPRTGKTPTMIRLIKELGTKCNLIIAPASLIWNWAKEFQNWYPECAVYVVNETLKKRIKMYTEFKLDERPKVLIISKNTLSTDTFNGCYAWETYFIKDRLFSFDTAIVDEAHFLRNYKTAQSKAVFHVKAERRYALSGTPTVKHPSDIWGILHFLHPDKFPSYWQFVDRYFEQSLDYMGHVEVGNVKSGRKQELQEMIALQSTQRKRKEVMPWLPDKQRSTFTVRLDGKQQKLYTDMAKHFMAVDGTLEVDTQNVITQLMRLRQLCLDPRLLGFDVPGVKTNALLEYLEDHREPVVIMSMFTSYLKLLKPEIEKLGLKVGEINGEMSNQQKQESATNFQNGNTQVLLCNIISAGTGFTLDNADTVIFTDKDWTPASNAQAEDRVCPTTVEKNHKHEILTFECAGTVDERMNEILSQKKSLTDIINEGGLAALRRLIGDVIGS